MPRIGSLLLSPRGRRWTVLAALLLAALALLGLVLSRRTPDPVAPPPPPPVRIRIVDASGAPIAGARVRCRAPEDAAPEACGVWSAEEATLTLPPGHRVDAVVALAPGYRPTRVPDLGRDSDVTLPPGPEARIILVPEAPPAPPAEVLLLVRPVVVGGRELAGPEQEDLATLIAAGPGLAGEASSDDALPAGQFGFVVGVRRAAAGIRVPEPGRYAVRWGLLDREAGLLFALDDEPARWLEVAVEGGPMELRVPVSAARMAEAREGLASRVRRLGER